MPHPLTTREIALATSPVKKHSDISKQEYAEVLASVFDYARGVLLAEHLRLHECTHDMHLAQQNHAACEASTQTWVDDDDDGDDDDAWPLFVKQATTSTVRKEGTTSTNGTATKVSAGRKDAVMNNMPAAMHAQIAHLRTLGSSIERSRQKKKMSMTSSFAQHSSATHVRAKLHLKNLGAMLSVSDHRFAKALNHLGSILHVMRLHPLIALDSFMALIIIMNAIVIGASCDSSDWRGWIVFDSVFCCLFIFEFLAKLLIMGAREYFYGADYHWHIFECVLIVLSVVEVLAEVGAFEAGFTGSSIFRVFRLVRLLKLLRICRLHFLADLVLMLNGAVGGIRTLFWSIVLICMPLFVVALVLRETLGQEEDADNGAEMFSSLTMSFFSVFRCVVAGDCTAADGRPIFVLVSARYGWGYGALYGFTVIVMVFGLFNVIVAIYVENTVAAAKYNDMKKKELRLRNQEMFNEKSLELAMLAYGIKSGIDISDQEHLMARMGDVDLDAIYSMEITQQEFKTICEHRGFRDLLTELDISVEDQKDLFDTLDIDRGGTLDINELISGIAKLRGDARRSDIVAVILSVRHVCQLLGEMMEVMDNQSQTLHMLKTTGLTPSQNLNFPGLSYSQTLHLLKEAGVTPSQNLNFPGLSTEHVVTPSPVAPSHVDTAAEFELPSGEIIA